LLNKQTNRQKQYTVNTQHRSFVDFIAIVNILTQTWKICKTYE